MKDNDTVFTIRSEDPDLHHTIKVIAAQQGVSISSMLRKALEDIVKKHQKKSKNTA